MTITDLLRAIAPNTPVRIHVFSLKDTLVGTTGPHATNDIIEMLRRKRSESAYVTAIYAQFHAQELYIECTNMLE